MNAIQPVSSNPHCKPEPKKEQNKKVTKKANKRILLDLATKFSCVYGISSPVKGIDQGCYVSIYRKETSTLIFTGHDGLIFWFVFEDTNKRIPYEQKRRYTQENSEEICSRVSDLMIRDGVVFSDIYAKRKTAVMTPLQEGVVDTWFNGRMVLIGDSGHKVCLTPHNPGFDEADKC